MFGVDRVPKERWTRAQSRQTRLDGLRLDASTGDVLPYAYWHSIGGASLPPVPGDDWSRDLDRQLSALSESFPLLGGNEAVPYLTGDAAFPPMLDAIRAARHHIHLQSFIIGDDPVGREFLDAVAERARAGVRCRVLYDRFASSGALLRGLFRRYRRVPNLSFAGWTQSNLFRRQLQFNLRNHRKILVIDGETAFAGGINLHACSRTAGGVPAIRDYHFRFRGPVVQELQYAFLRDWHVMTGEDPALFLTGDYFRRLAPAGGVPARVVPSGPSSGKRVADDLFFAALNAARSRIFLITPYFLPGDDILRSLRMAALRGVRTDIVLPEKSNHIYTTWASRALYEDLLESGVRIHERRAPFIHAKALAVDGRLSVVGSANWDYRSLHSNYETCIVLHDADFTARLETMMHEDLAASRPVDLAAFSRRPVLYHYLENLCGLLTPLL